MRIFTAFPISPEIRDELIALQSEIRALNPKMPVKWTGRDNFHVTLEFLGDLSEHQVETVKKILAGVATRHQPFVYWLNRIGGFPNLARPHVLTVEAGDEHRRSELLHEDFYQNLVREGLTEPHDSWTPHLTLGRVKREWNLPVGLNTMRVRQLTWPVDKIELISSELRHNGPVYTILETYKLGL